MACSRRGGCHGNRRIPARQLLHHENVWNRILDERLPDDRISESRVEIRGRGSRVCRHAIVAALAGKGLGKPDHCCARAFSLPGRMNGDLPHFHGAPIDGLQEQCRNQPGLGESTEMKTARLIVEFGLRPFQAERCPQNRVPQSDSRLVIRRSELHRPDHDFNSRRNRIAHRCREWFLIASSA